MGKAKKTEIFFNSLCVDYYKNILRYLFRVLGEENTARDVVQEVFLAAWLKKDQLMEHPNPGGWLFQTAKNLACKAKRESFSRCMAEEPLEGEGIQEPQDQTSGIEWVLDSEIDEERYIDQVLSTLTPEKRQLYALHYMKGISMREIAKKMDMEETAIRMRYMRLRNEIRKIVAQVAEKNFYI